jgi:hypothetical protein
MIEDDNDFPETGFTAVPPPPPDSAPADELRPDPEPPAEVLPPTPVVLRTEGGVESGRARPVMAALTDDALWLQETWKLRHFPLSALAGIERPADGMDLILTFHPETSAESLRLTFDDTADARRWHERLQVSREQLPVESPSEFRHVPEGVTLLMGVAEPSHVVVGRVEFTGHTTRTADRGLQLRAALRGADAVVMVSRHKGSGTRQGICHASGVAIRVEDAAERQRLRRCWFSDEVRVLTNRMFLLLVCQMALLLVINLFCAGATPFHQATGETPLESLRSTALGLGLVFGWPLLLVILLRVLRRPELLPAAGLAILAATTGRGLTVLAAHLLAIQGAGATPNRSMFWVLFDPVDWAFIILGLLLSVRAWRLAGDAADILPRDGPTVPAIRRVWSRGLLVLSGVGALAVLGFIGKGRYDLSAYLAQPGIDTRREQEALLAFNKGVAFGEREEWANAERSFQDSLRVWEELTKGRAVPPAYRAHLGLTLYNIAWVSHH